jgi:YcxB-like protein
LPSITYNLNRGDLFFGLMTIVLRNRMLQVSIVSLIVFSEVLVVVFGLGEGLFSSTIVLSVVFAFALCLAIFISQAVLALAMAYLPKERGVVGEHTLEITEQGLIERTEFNESLHKWAAMYRVVSQLGYLYIYVSYSVYHQVPKRRVDAQQMAAFENELRARMAGENRLGG